MIKLLKIELYTCGPMNKFINLTLNDKSMKIPFHLKAIKHRIIDIIQRDKDEVAILKTENHLSEYWVNQNLLIHPWETHWFQLRDNTLFKLKRNLLVEIISKGIKKAGNTNRFCKKLNLGVSTVYNLINGRGISMISVRKLRRILTYMNIPYVSFNSKIEYTKKGKIISIMNPKFPINLNNPDGAWLLGCIVSDGCIYLDKSSRHVFRTKYASGDQESIDLFHLTINRVFGKTHVHTELERNCTVLRIGSSIIGEALLKIGAILGHKASVNEDLPWMVKSGDLNLKKSYLRAVFSDEGSLYCGPTKNSNYITLSRYSHIKNISQRQKQFLKALIPNMKSKRFPTGHETKRITIKSALGLEPELRPLIEINLPKLLLDERKMLSEFGIDSRFWKQSLNLTHLGKWSICCDVIINKKKSILQFARMIGFNIRKKKAKLNKIVKKLKN